MRSYHPEDCASQQFFVVVGQLHVCLCVCLPVCLHGRLLVGPDLNKGRKTKRKRWNLVIVMVCMVCEWVCVCLSACLSVCLLTQLLISVACLSIVMRKLSVLFWSQDTEDRLQWLYSLLMCVRLSPMNDSFSSTWTGDRDMQKVRPGPSGPVCSTDHNALLVVGVWRYTKRTIRYTILVSWFHVRQSRYSHDIKN